MNFSFFQPVFLEAAPAAAKFAIFDSGFLITVALIIFSTLLIAFIQHIKKDKCIKSFKSDIVSVYLNNGKVIKGRLDVENTGVELILTDSGNGDKRSHIFYKDEYDQIRFFARFHSDMDKKRAAERRRVIKKTYHPTLFRKMGRSIGIFFKIIRDSFMDIFATVSGKMKTVNPDYASNEVYLSRVNKEAVSSIDTTHNPLLEKYIGNKVVCIHLYNGKVYEITGILKDYTGNYIELLDVDFIVEDINIKNADLVIPRTSNKVRHLGEDAVKSFSLQGTFNLERYKKRIKKSSHGENTKAETKE